MKLAFEETQARYISGSQSARAWTERWARDWIYCPNCGSPKIEQFENNRPVADFYCGSCQEEYELKTQKKNFGPKIIDGAYKKMRERLASDNNPNLLLMNYDYSNLAVTDLIVVPKHFFVLEIIEELRALSPTARRAGW
ncbi:MAG: restriction endonuclease, partial [Hyphomicrobiales bacterium]|nr:restriction endonuclease [Hyphomicrobiales bacterium]